MNTRTWRKFYASKAKFPTRGATVGHKEAKKHIESLIGKVLRDPVIKTHGNNWVFMERKVHLPVANLDMSGMVA